MKAPAHSIIEKLGGPAAVAAIANVHLSRVYRWMAPKSQGGTGGVIPQRHWPGLLAKARAEGVELSTDEFLPLLPPVPSSGDPSTSSSDGAPAGACDIAPAGGEVSRMEAAE